MDGKHNLHLVDTIQSSSYSLQATFSTIWPLSDGHGRQAFQRPHCSQQEGCGRAAAVFAEVRARAGEEGCGVSFFNYFPGPNGHSKQVHEVHQNRLGLAGFSGFG